MKNTKKQNKFLSRIISTMSHLWKHGVKFIEPLHGRHSAARRHGGTLLTGIYSHRHGCWRPIVDGPYHASSKAAMLSAFVSGPTANAAESGISDDPRSESGMYPYLRGLALRLDEGLLRRTQELRPMGCPPGNGWRPAPWIYE